jgi:hypothetical protein
MDFLSMNKRSRQRLQVIVLSVGLGMIGLPARAALEREFVWESFGESETLHVRIPTELQNHYADKSRTYHYAQYVLEDAGYELSGKLAKAFEDRAADQGWSDWELINMVVDFVQSLEYQSEQGEYPKYPVETLMDGGGDCEDTAILLAAILDKLTVNCVLLSPPGHMAVGVAIDGLPAKHYAYNGRKYYYVETTGRNWNIGAIPPAYAGAAKVYALPSDPDARRTVAAATQLDPSPVEDSDVTNIMVAFYREQTTQVDAKTKHPLYDFQVRIEAEDAVLQAIQEVQYRLTGPHGEPNPNLAWMRAYQAADGFAKQWTATAYTPVQVRIYFEDGTFMETQVDFAESCPSD